METVKRLCTFFRRFPTRESEAARLQDLPPEILLNIFELLPGQQSSQLRNECRVFRLAVAIGVKDALRRIRSELRMKTLKTKEKVVEIITDHRMVHPGLLRSLLSWRNLQTDVSLLSVMVWRYRNDMIVWCPLANILRPIIEELDEEIKTLSHEEWKPVRKKVSHPHLNNFLMRFGDEIEIHFYNSEMLVPFEVRLIDLLLCCPCGNLRMVVNHNTSGCKRIEMFSELRNLKETALKPRISSDNTRWQNETEILKYMRNYIRNANIAYVQSVIKQIENYGKNIDDLAFSYDLKEIISFISTGDESCVDHSQRTLENGDVEEIYENCSSTNLGKSGLYCAFEVRSSVRKQESFSRVAESNLMCVACTHPTINNVFTLGITKQGNNFVKEMLVIYEPEKENYTLQIYKHQLK